jgi:hypothetical protein
LTHKWICLLAKEDPTRDEARIAFNCPKIGVLIEYKGWSRSLSLEVRERFAQFDDRLANL